MVTAIERLAAWAYDLAIIDVPEVVGDPVLTAAPTGVRGGLRPAFAGGQVVRDRVRRVRPVSLEVVEELIEHLQRLGRLVGMELASSAAPTNDHWPRFLAAARDALNAELGQRRRGLALECRRWSVEQRRWTLIGTGRAEMGTRP